MLGGPVTPCGGLNGRGSVLEPSQADLLMSSKKQSVLMGLLSGALVVAISSAVCLYLSRDGHSPVSAHETTDATRAVSATELPWISPPSATNSMKELFGLKQGAEEAKTAPDKLTKAAFSQTFTLGQDRYFAQFFQSQQLLGAGDVNESHAATVTLSVLTYKQVTGTWQVVDKEIGLTESGTWGQLLSVPVETLQLSSGSVALLVEEGTTGQGYTEGGKTVLVFTNDQWHDTGVIHTSSSNGGACDPDYKSGASDAFMNPCYEYTGTISVAPGAKGDFPNLIVTKQGTQAGDDPTQIIQVKNLVVKYTNGKYEEQAVRAQP